MYKLMANKGQLFALLLGILVIAIFLISVISGIGNAGYSVSDDLNQILKNNPDADFGFFNIGLQLTILLIIIAVVAGVIFGIFHLISSPRSSLKLMIGVVLIVLIFFILYQTSTSETSGKVAELLQEHNIAENTSKMISGGLKTTVGLALGAIVIMILFEIRNMFK